MRSAYTYIAAGAAACAVLFASPAVSQTSDPSPAGSVITVDGRRIGMDEFESRLNLFSVGFPADLSERKRSIALSLIQETVLAQAARDAHIDTLPQVKAVVRQYEKEAAYEEWMNREVRSKVAVTDQEVRRAYDLYRQQRVLDYRIYSDSMSARKAERRFRRALSKNAAASDTLTQTKYLEYGEAYRHVEDEIFAMKPGETRLLPVDGKWYLFRLKEVRPHPTRSKQNFPESYDAVMKLVRKEKELQLLGTKMSALMAGRSFTLARQAREYLYRLLAERIPFANPQISKFPELVNQEIARRLPPDTDLKERFLTFRDGSSMSLGELWNAISTGPFLLNYRSPAELRGGIDYLIRRVIIVETIADAAYRMGLEHSPYAVQQKAMWADNLLSNLFQYHLSETHPASVEELGAESDTAKESPGKIRSRVLQRKTHAAIDSIMNERCAHVVIAVDTAALYRAHALEGDIVVRKEHFPNRFAVPRVIPANPEAAWARRLLQSWGGR